MKALIMNTDRIKNVLTASILIFLFLTGCEKNVIPVQETYIYEPCSVTILEPQSKEILNQPIKYSYRENDNIYYFSETINIENRNTFINAQKQLFHQLVQLEYVDIDVPLTYYLLEEYPSRSDSNTSQMYLSSEDILSYKQVLTTLQTVYGDEANYGLLYGLSNLIAFDLGWETDIPDISKQDIISFVSLSENSIFFSLDYPCFLETYNKVNLDIVKSISIDVARYTLQHQSISYLVELFSLQNDSQMLFNEEFSDIINQWLLSIGSSTQFAPRKTLIAFSYGGTVSPLIIRTAHAVYYLYEDYEESQTMHAKIDYFKSDYQTLIFTIETLEKDMDNIDFQFKDPEKEYSPYSIVLCSYQQTYDFAGAFAYYSSWNHTSYNSSVMAITHEYVHYLTTPSIGYNWQYESVAIYYNLFSYFQSLSSTSELDAILQYQTPEAIALLEFLQRDFNSDDFPVYCDIVVLHRNIREVNAMNPFAMISIINYVKNEYGDEITKQIFLHQGTIEDEISLSWNELITGWSQWLDDTYSLFIQ